MFDKKELEIMLEWYNFVRIKLDGPIWEGHVKLSKKIIEIMESSN